MYRPFDAFRPVGNVISVIGSGGKTTLLRHLSKRIPGRVILTTSTHIFPFPDMPLVDTADGDRERALRQLRSALSSSRVACLGCRQPSGKLSSPSEVIAFEALANEADAIIVEADGAAGRPLKAHRPWEPVIPTCTTMTICVIGASGLGRPASQVCHCPELFAALAGISPDDMVEAAHVAKVVNREGLADCCLVNQIDVLPNPETARRLCELIQMDAYSCSLAPHR